jgi:hypothetical protein
MALVVKDRVQETSTTTGTGTLTLSGAATGYQSFSSAIGNGNTTYYAISNGTDWEVGVGTVGSGTLSRDTVLESSNAGSLVNFSAGVKTVFCTYPAERSVNTEDIGVSIQAYDADTAKYDDATANFTGTLQNGGSNVLVDTDIGSTVEAYDSTILKSASIGVTVQAYDADTAKYDDATANFTGTLQNGGSNVVVDTDIGSTVQGYDADTAKYDDTTANFTGTLQNGGSNVVVDTDIGSTVQAYDADTTKNDVANTFTATNTFTANQIISVTDNTNAALRITQTGTGNALVVEDSASPDSTPFVIDADGKVFVGNTTSRTLGAGVGALMQITGGTVPLSFYRDANSSTAINLEFAKARSGGAILANGDVIGRVYFSGSDGTAQKPAAFIDAAVDGTPGTNDMPGRLVFSTTADGASTPTERMRLTSAGGVSFGSSGTAYGTTGQVLTSNGNAPPTWGNGVTIASTAEAQAGTNNTNVITPLRLREGFNASGTAPVYACRAWVNFNSIGTLTVRASGNVSSVTDNGVSNYTINFTNAMPDANYAIAGAARITTSVQSANVGYYGTGVVSTTQVQIRSIQHGTSGNSYVDCETVSCAVFR